MKTFIYCIAVSTLFAAQAWAETAVDGLNELLRGERSAVETYEQALQKVGTEPRAESLRKSLQNHRSAVNEISTEITKAGGVPDKTSGAWGAWASTVTGTAKLFGDSAALKALKEGEEHGVKEYQEILDNKNISENFKAKVRDEYLPQQREHIASIDSWLKQIS